MLGCRPSICKSSEGPVGVQLQGNKCHPLFEEAAQKAAALLAKYEGAHTPAIVVREGAACAALHCWAGPPEDVRDADAPILARELEAYDRDFRVRCSMQQGCCQL